MGKLPGQTDKVGNIERLGARGGCDTASLKGGIEHVLGKAVGAHGIADGLATLSKCSINHAGHKFAIESFGHHTVNTVDTHDGRVHVWRRHKATRRHLKATRYLRIQAKLCRIAAIGLVARHCGNAIGNLLLHHDDGALERRHRLEKFAK